MPRDANQVYSLPEAPFSANTLIEASRVNNNFSDVGTALTASLTRGETSVLGRQIVARATAGEVLDDLGATTTGKALVAATDGAAGRTALGFTATGNTLATAADAAAGRSALVAAALPTVSAGVGQVVAINTSPGNGYTLPTGGTWFAVWCGFNGNAFSIGTSVTVAAGATTIQAGLASVSWQGFAWRIA